MRLTLRTLLAYRDGVLSPEDAEDMHRRIHQSEDAANLLKRIESISSEMQKPSSTIVGKGLAADPNSIAEYLDDVLESESIPALEKTCLESNAYLAELADCHSILSSALNTRVEVPEGLRQTALKIDDGEHRKQFQVELKQRQKSVARSPKTNALLRMDAPHGDPTQASDDDIPSSMASSNTTDRNDANAGPGVVENDDLALSTSRAVEVQAPMMASGGESIKEQGLNLEGDSLSQEVPEYLLGAPRGNWKLPVAICGLFALLAVLIWQALGPIGRVQELLASSDPQPATNKQNAPDPNAPQASDSENENTVGEEDTKSDSEQFGSPNSPEPNPGTDSVAELPSSSSGENAGTNNEAPGNDRNATRNDSVGDPNVIASGKRQSMPVPPDNASADASAGNPNKDLPFTWRPTINSSPELLLGLDANSQLFRMPPNSGLPIGQQVVIPPNATSNLVDKSDVTWHFAGPTLAKVSPDGMQSNLGRFLLSADLPGKSTVLETPQRKIKIALLDQQSKVAVEVTYRRAKQGSVTEPDVFMPVLLIVAAEGNAEIEELGTGKSLSLGIAKGVSWIGAADGKVFSMNRIPQWYRMRPSRPIDAEAVLEMSVDLNPDPQKNEQNVTAALARLAAGRRPEEAALAIQTQILIGDWSGFASKQFLGNSRMTVHWGSTIQLASIMLASDPSAAQELQKSLKKHFTSSDTMYQMLVGLPEDQLASGQGFESLINELESPELAHRCTAYFELNRLTGEQLAYKPTVPNRASVLSWRRMLSTKRLNVLPIPNVLWEAQP
ncbi:MAG: hypothetical protein AAF483_21260 [Planctomycetota bacterium]